MNWFTNASNVIVEDGDDTCPHLNVGDRAVYRERENDSFGPVAGYCYCEACNQERIRKSTPYDVTEDWLFHIVQKTCFALVNGDSKNYQEERQAHLDIFIAALESAKSVGFQRIEGKGELGYGTDYRIFIGNAEGVLDHEFKIIAPHGDEDILARYTDVVCQLTKHIEHHVLGVWMNLPVQVSSKNQSWLILEGNLISSDFTNLVEDSDGSMQYRWKTKPEKVTIYPVSEYETMTCHDCKKVVFKKDTIEWKWYDFYAPQGDEPLIICKDCKCGETHKARKARDRADYEHEFGGPDHEDGD